MKTPRQIWQQKQHQVLESLKDVKVIAGDLLVYENGAKDDEKPHWELKCSSLKIQIGLYAKIQI
jgi:hypothetical protein